jgi:hypothetical protein
MAGKPVGTLEVREPQLQLRPTVARQGRRRERKNSAGPAARDTVTAPRSFFSFRGSNSAHAAVKLFRPGAACAPGVIGCCAGGGSLHPSERRRRAAHSIRLPQVASPCLWHQGGAGTAPSGSGECPGAPTARSTVGCGRGRSFRSRAGGDGQVACEAAHHVPAEAAGNVVQAGPTQKWTGRAGIADRGGQGVRVGGELEGVAAASVPQRVGDEFPDDQGQRVDGGGVRRVAHACSTPSVVSVVLLGGGGASPR